MGAILSKDQSHDTVLVPCIIMAGTEAIGFAIGVMGLLPLCADGFAFIGGMIKAEQGLRDRWFNVFQQYGLITKWANIW